MEIKKLDIKVRKIWYIRNSILSLVIALFILPAIFIGLPAIISAIILIILIDTTVMLWPCLKYKYYSFGYDDKRIAINYGVIFRHKIIIPIRQIQDLHTYNGPIMSLMGLSGVIISTAGSNFSIAGMLTNDANIFVENLESLLNARLDGDEHEEVQ